MPSGLPGRFARPSTVLAPHSTAPPISTRPRPSAAWSWRWTTHPRWCWPPPIEAASAAEAPGIRHDLRPGGALDLVDRLDQAEFHLSLGSLPAPGERFSDMRLFEQGFAVLVREGHPIALDGHPGPEALAAYPHVELSSTGEGTGFVETALAERGLQRRVAIRIQLLAAAAALARSDMVAVVGERTARTFAAIAPLAVQTLPFPSPRLVTALL